MKKRVKKIVDDLNLALGVVRRGDIHEHHAAYDSMSNAIEAAIHELGGKVVPNPDEDETA